MTKETVIGVKLICGEKITVDDLNYLRKYKVDERSKLLSDEQLLKARRGLLTPAQKGRQTVLRRYAMYAEVDRKKAEKNVL